MDIIILNEKNQKKIERFILAVYTFYSIFMMLDAREKNWNDGFTIIVIAMLFVAWVVNVGKIKDYLFRAKITSIFIQCTVVLYAVLLDNVKTVIPLFLVSVMLLGLYGYEKMLYISLVSVVVVFFYHLFISKTIELDSELAVRNITGHFFTILLTEYIIYIWTKRNREGSDRLIEIIEESKEVENSKDDFLANVSHEIRTPINTICGMSELLLHDNMVDNARDKVLDIRMAGLNLMSIVSDILDFSELYSGKMGYEAEAYNIRTTINDVIDMAIAKKNGKRIELIVDCDANIPSVMLGDEKKLRRVMLNIVNNAIKFTEKGCVSLIVGYRKESYGVNLIITIKDTGIGIDEESLEKSFRSFNQVDSSRRRKEGGVGLGLAISHALVEKMGGAITIKSRVGKGTTVRFVIPQQVLDESPIATINDKSNVNVATYIDVEQYDMEEIRDEYTNNIIHMAEQLKGRCHMCRNFAELQRRYEKKKFSHVFISIIEYRVNREYFEELAKKTKVVIVLERKDEKYIKNGNFIKVYKPFDIFAITAILNGEYSNNGTENVTESFVAPDAHVLVVDDNKMNLRVIEGFLGKYKIKVTTAISGKEALEKVESEDYDFIFMDHMMPDMDGVETLHKIRNKVGAYYHNVPIIALTANAVAGAREALMKEGFNGFLEKPLEKSVLERTIKRNISPEKIITIKKYTNTNINVNTEVDLSRNTEEIESVNEDVNTNSQPVYEEIESNNEANKLVIDGLDTKTGILYCNGEEEYIKILQAYCMEYMDLVTDVKKLFESEDWKNYTIAVHGIKSAMKSIGAMHVSELAKGLESAGRENRVDYIKENHNELVEQYESLFAELKKVPCIQEGLKELEEEKAVEEIEETEDIVMEELTEEIFNEVLETMEAAMYELETDKMLEELDKLKNHKYCGVSLNEYVSAAKRNIVMSDYMTAVEKLGEIKKALEERRNK